jgi:hypothetical protein
MKGGVVVISFLVVEFFFVNHLVCQEIQKSQYGLLTYLSKGLFHFCGRFTSLQRYLDSSYSSKCLRLVIARPPWDSESGVGRLGVGWNSTLGTWHSPLAARLPFGQNLI